MTALLAGLAVLVTGAAVVVAALVYAVTRAWSPAVPVLLELLLAAGLLRLAADPDWRAVAAAAVLVLVRRGVTLVERRSGRAEEAAGAPPVRLLPT
ncbi:hypothetical protein [Nocardioides perillae]|uniref:Uncharacterized protein n=1 Tax=Nocardioides perillae TaxID=1119534 RepID=A0A7Y9US82_9ACTN|nr:hypothetical protein [Nocardioides perillae]NYG55364.1 hypothetical protein [Nocardioides perillae]